MNYSGKKVAVTGAHGFIGAHLTERLMGMSGVFVDVLEGDIRSSDTFARLDYSYDYLFHFGAPSSQVQFKRNPAHCIESTIKGFINVAYACKTNNIRLVYPSTGLLSTGETNEYARCKKICEDWATGNSMDAIGLRIFATYGPGEGHKRDYASVPYLFARDVVGGRQPEIYGDGEQVRDFIYIDDVVSAILILAEECPDAIVDIGSGQQTSFKDICRELVVAGAGEVDPVYIDKPYGYVMETAANPTRLHDFYKPEVNFETGIKRLVKHLREVK